MTKASIAELPQRLKSAGYQAPSYRQLYGHVLDGQLADLIERERGRWVFKPELVPQIARQLGLPLTSQAA